ncbi:hypothetical protein [Nocardiopsis ganjiahuensis]|uniref:hypothetical protein n=1 Tax=Nocardiopsis ganjiahuensis TaxID=239984 RepID=UPI0003494866|nr:hypothetical protein [Nocardiopsis ganjiahuensis]
MRIVKQATTVVATLATAFVLSAAAASPASASAVDALPTGIGTVLLPDVVGSVCGTVGNILPSCPNSDPWEG